jgi:hypothetical protein
MDVVQQDHEGDGTLDKADAVHDHILRVQARGIGALSEILAE